MAIQNGTLVMNGFAIGGSPAVENSRDLLWSNPEENSGQNLSAFTPQTISLDLSKYEAIEITYCLYNRTMCKTLKFNIGSSISKYVLDVAIGSDTSGWYVNNDYRKFTVSASGITFEDAYRCINGLAQDVANNYCIPLKIYGIKPGYIQAPDADKGYVSVVADGVKTRKQLLEELYTKIDWDKVSEKTVLRAGKLILHLTIWSNRVLVFSAIRNASSFLYCDMYTLDSTASAYQGAIYANSYSRTDETATVVPSGEVYKIVY